MSMRILILGNMANDGYSVAKELRNMDVDVDLGINESDFGMALPEWEDGNISSHVDPFNISKKDVEGAWKSPGWIRYFDFLNKVPRKKNRIRKIKVRIKIMRMMREYDVIETQVPWAMYAQFSGIPYVAYDAGWIRYFPFGKGIRDKLVRRGYSKAKKILFTNADTLPIFKSQKYLDMNKIHFVPFAIDPEKYKPIDASELRSKFITSDGLLIFSPARQIWEEKGNDKIISAYAQFVKNYPNSKFVLVDWSIDKEKSKSHAKSLGMEDNIVWINPVPKNQLIQYYNASDIVIDQAVLGGWGTSTPEAMSCGKPTMTSWAGKDKIDEPSVIKCFGEAPPALHCWHIDEIFDNLMRLAKDDEYRIELGKRCREWVIKTHHPKLVAEKHLEVLQS